LKKIAPYPSQYHLIKLLYFSSSLKPHIYWKRKEKKREKKNPLWETEKKFKYLNPYALITQL
jgi:hypothetical protein